MASLLSAMFTPTAYRRDRGEEKLGASAQTMSDLIGRQAMHHEDAVNLEDLQDTGMYENAPPELVTQLKQIQGMATSGDPLLQQKALAQYDEFIKPPTARAPLQDPNSYREYALTTNNPTKAGYADYMTKKQKREGGIGGGAMSLKDIQDVGIRNAENVLRPVRNPALTNEDIQTGAGLAPGESYEVMPTAGERDLAGAREASLRGWTEINNLLFAGDDPIFGDDYDSDMASQIQGGIDEFTQANPKLAVYNSTLEGLAAQFARNISGEKGALRTDDIDRAKALFPSIPRMTLAGPKKGDSKVTAMMKMDILTRLLQLPQDAPHEEVEELLQAGEALTKAEEDGPDTSGVYGKDYIFTWDGEKEVRLDL